MAYLRYWAPRCIGFGSAESPNIRQANKCLEEVLEDLVAPADVQQQHSLAAVCSPLQSIYTGTLAVFLLPSSWSGKPSYAGESHQTCKGMP